MAYDRVLLFMAFCLSGQVHHNQELCRRGPVLADLSWWLVRTQATGIEKRNMEDAGRLTVSKYLQMFTQFTKEERVKIAEKINQMTFEERWQSLDQELPDIEITEEEIMKEVRAVRYGKKN